MSGPILRRMADGLTNVITGLGTARDARRGRAYNATALNQQTIDQAYRGSGMLRKVIDIPALDMVREWRDWQAESDQIELLEAEESRLAIRGKVRQAEVLRGLGGGALILGVAGDPAMPANERVTRTGGLAFIHVVSRWQLQLGDMIEDPADPLYGGPAFFKMQAGRGQQYRLHPSRVICFKGDPLPTIITATTEDAFWGEGRIARVLEASLNLDETLGSFAALIKDARNIDIGVPKLLEQVATQDGEARLMTRLGLMVEGMSIIRANVYDAGDAEGKGGEKIDRHQLTWTGIPEIIRVTAEALSASSDIPMTRLWGKSAEGMSASGDSQQRDWTKMIRAMQELNLRPSLDQLDAYLIPSALGSRPADVWWQFAPLDTPSEAEEATRFKTTMEAMKLAQDMAFIPDVAFAKGGQNTMSENGWMPGLDGALAEIPEDERFGITAEPDDTDPSALTQQQEGGDPNLAGAGASGSPPRRRAANDKRGVGKGADTPFDDSKRGKRAQLGRRAAASHFDPSQPRDRNGRWIPAGTRSLINDATAGRTGGKQVVIGSVGKRAADMARRAGLSIEGKGVALDPSLTRHVIVRHGKEVRPGQKSVGAGDIAAAATLLNGAHTMRRVAPARTGVERFALVTRSKGQQVFAIYENRKKAVALVTMWLR